MDYYLSLLVLLKDILKETRYCKFTKGVFCFHENAPAHSAISTKANGPPWGSNILIPTLFLRIGPVGLPFVSRTENSVEKSYFYDVGVISAAETWLNGKTLIFLSGLQKLEQRAKKCIELRREYFE